MPTRRTKRWVQLLLLAAVACVAGWAAARPALAYSSFPDYVRPVQEGGGGGRFFSGTPADPHGCDVCHRGARGAPLEILGLPEGGYVPGQSYELRFVWPATAPHVALMTELTDLAGAPAGVLALAPYATWSIDERCESGDPAADICRIGGEGSGCCREVGMLRDACSFPDQRSVFWVLDCGSKAARAVWTAPGPGVGDVWFSTSMVTSDIMNDARGDGATTVRKRLRPVGTPKEVTAAVGSCQLGGARVARTGWSWVAALLACVAIAFRRAARRSLAHLFHSSLERGR